MGPARKEKCTCCTGCSEFQRILDLKQAGLVIYRHINRKDEINKANRQLESFINAKDDIFIIQNTNDIPVLASDCVSGTVEEIRCPRCSELVKRAQKYLQYIPLIDKKDIISVCDHCKIKKLSHNYCECHKIIKKFHDKQKKQRKAKELINMWLSKMHNLLKILSTEKNVTKLRARSELYLNSIFKDRINIGDRLEVKPMFDTEIKMSESLRSINATKSESALMFPDSKCPEIKLVTVKSESFIQIEKLASSITIDLVDKQVGGSQATFNIGNNINEKVGKFIKKKIQHDNCYETLNTYYSGEEISFSAAVIANREVKNVFSYVFPKSVTDENVPLRRVKTSTELIEDTQELLRSQAAGKNNIMQPLVSHGPTIKREIKVPIKISDTPDYKDDNLRNAKYQRSQGQVKNKINHNEHKSSKEKLQKGKKVREKEIELHSEKNTVPFSTLKEKKILITEKKKKTKKEQSTKEKQMPDEEQSQLKKQYIKTQDKKEKTEKQHKEEATNYAANLKKMRDAQTKRKTEPLKIEKKQEEDNKRSKLDADKKIEEKPERKLKALSEANNLNKLDQEKSKANKIIKTQEQLAKKELSIARVKMRRPSPDDLILQLVKLQPSKNYERKRPQRLSEINVTPLIINEHKVHKGAKSLDCVMCLNSELELDVENIMNRTGVKADDMNDIIVGNKILKTKYPLKENPQIEEVVLCRSLFKEEEVAIVQKEIVQKIIEKRDHEPLTLLSQNHAEQELPKGVIRYALSDRSFIDKGWTMLPTEKVVRKMNIYRMRPAHPEFDWFDRNKNKRLMLYDTGEKLAEFNNGRGRWFYRNGKLALDYYDAEEMNAQQRLVIYGSGESDEHGRYQPASILATFDYLGNGVVFDHKGKIRLKYNQTEGIVLDRGIGPVSQWKWHTLNDPPVLQQVMIDTQMAHKDPDILRLGGPADDKVRPDNEEMLAIEFDNFIKEKNKKLSQKFKPFQIRTKALKINEHFSLRILDQANIYLIFRDGTTNIKINIGMLLDHHEIVDTDTAEVGEVSNNLERYPARTDSLAGLQASIAHAQRIERLLVQREHRLRRPEPASSADKLVAAVSRPMRSQLKTVPSSSSTVNDECYYKCRKPPIYNIYYNTRLV